MRKIHVLLVDHDSNAHAATVDIFEYFSYKVTSVTLASGALSILSKGKPKFDLLVENIKSPDFCGYKLLQIALQMDMPVILLLDEDDLVFTKRALATGVLLCIKKPVPVEIARYLWQLVVREKIRKKKEIWRFIKLTTPKKLHNGVREEDLIKGFSSGYTSLNESYKVKKKMKCSENANQEDNTIIFKRKLIEWTQELHERFVYAIRKLGEGKCYPKDIIELMNVPGLTRMQVANHLQKCRRGTWLHPTERKLRIGAPMPTFGKTSNPSKVKRYGSMPPLIFNPQPRSNVQENDENGQDESSKVDNVLGCDSEGLSQEVYKPFSDVGVGAIKMEPIEQVFDMDDFFKPEEKFVITPTANTSLGDQSRVIDEIFGFPNMYILIQNFCASQQVEIDDGGSCDLDQFYYNENEVPVVLDTEKDKCGEA
ncbi:hypothetical protein ACS0TY_003187 [Phlomoides rotata]